MSSAIMHSTKLCLMCFPKMKSLNFFKFLGKSIKSKKLVWMSLLINIVVHYTERKTSSATMAFWRQLNWLNLINFVIYLMKNYICCNTHMSHRYETWSLKCIMQKNEFSFVGYVITKEKYPKVPNHEPDQLTILLTDGLTTWTRDQPTDQLNY